MIDTGATHTVVPTKMAEAAGLPIGKSIQAETAGGLVAGQLTVINELKIGNAQIDGLEADINEHIDKVLIGMNTLKYFHMTQDESTLTLTII